MLGSLNSLTKIIEPCSLASKPQQYLRDMEQYYDVISSLSIVKQSQAPSQSGTDALCDFHDGIENRLIPILI